MTKMKTFSILKDPMFCHHLVEFDKIQDLDLYHQKVLIKF